MRKHIDAGSMFVAPSPHVSSESCVLSTSSAASSTSLITTRAKSLTNICRQPHGKEHVEIMQPIVDHQDDEGNYVPRDFADWREIPSETL